MFVLMAKSKRRSLVLDKLDYVDSLFLFLFSRGHVGSSSFSNGDNANCIIPPYNFGVFFDLHCHMITMGELPPVLTERLSGTVLIELDFSHFAILRDKLEMGFQL